MIGILCKFECPSCGNVISKASPFWNSDVRKKLKEPTKCGCGRKGEFRLFDFERCEFTVLMKGTKVVDKNGKTLMEHPNNSDD